MLDREIDRENEKMCIKVKGECNFFYLVIEKEKWFVEKQKSDFLYVHARKVVGLRLVSAHLLRLSLGDDGVEVKNIIGGRGCLLDLERVWFARQAELPARHLIWSSRGRDWCLAGHEPNKFLVFNMLLSLSLSRNFIWFQWAFN